jgi:hypothetical protein|tara:strand:+ start:1544 stop:1687 length:144 start_codon:yes stop_codon:yes gene_type:complete
MPHPFYMRKPDEELPKKAVKSDIRVGTLIKNIFNNLGEIIKILVKWR